jgi:hypothetical protein
MVSGTFFYVLATPNSKMVGMLGPWVCCGFGWQVRGNDLVHLGGNGVFLSNSVDAVVVEGNSFRFLGTSGVLLAGRTGGAMMDARDGEVMAAAGEALCYFWSMFS